MIYSHCLVRCRLLHYSLSSNSEIVLTIKLSIIINLRFWLLSQYSLLLTIFDTVKVIIALIISAITICKWFKIRDHILLQAVAGLSAASQKIWLAARC